MIEFHEEISLSLHHRSVVVASLARATRIQLAVWIDTRLVSQSLITIIGERAQARGL
jgi:hypothetical protein